MPSTSSSKGRQHFDTFLHNLRPSLLALARRLCGQSGIDPEDLVQEALERALCNADKLSMVDENACRAWVCTTLTHRFLDHCRRRRTETVGGPALRVVEEDIVPFEAPPRENWELVTEDDFRKAISRLPERLRTAYELHAAGLRYRAIAKKLDVPEGTVGSWLTQARRELKEMLLSVTATEGVIAKS